MQRVLVVDDEPSVRSLVSLSLEGQDCKVEAFCDGRDALEALAPEYPDLILLDVGLPGMSGDEVLRRLRADERTAAIPVVLLTGIEPTGGQRSGRRGTQAVYAGIAAAVDRSLALLGRI